MRCLTGNRFSMNAEVLTWTGITQSDSTTVDQSGTWVTYQDPITGEILNRWIPTSTGETDNPDTPGDESLTTVTIPCLARGIVDGGIRVAGTTERFGDMYENIDFVKLWTPAHVRVTKRDRITNIRWKKGGEVIWLDEEGDSAPTIFNVNGVTPLFDAFNRHVENFVLLERASNT